MQKKIVLILFLTLILTKIIAQTSDKQIIYKAYIDGKMSVWKTHIDKMQATPKKTNAYRLELVNYQYGYIAWCIGSDKDDEAEVYLNIALDHIEALENQIYQIHILNAYKSAFWGFKIGLAMYKAPFLGPESMEFAELSVKNNPNNYFGYIQLGNIEYYMPSTFGGSKVRALEYYIKAEKIMYANTELTNSNWNYLSLLVTIAQAFEHFKQYETAKLYYEKCLKIEPNFKWVKNQLYPELTKKMSKK